MEEQMPECQVCSWKHGKQLLGNNLPSCICWGQENGFFTVWNQLLWDADCLWSCKNLIGKPFFLFPPFHLALDSPVYTECSGTQSSCFTEQEVFKKCFWIYNTHNFLIARIWIGPNKEIKSLHRNWLVTDYSFYACSVWIVLILGITKEYLCF